MEASRLGMWAEAPLKKSSSLLGKGCMEAPGDHWHGTTYCAGGAQWVVGCQV